MTGAAGSVGRRVVALLAAELGDGAVRAFDRDPLAPLPGVEFHQFDIAGPQLVGHLTGAETVIHLAEDRGRRSDITLALEMLDRVLAAAAEVGCGRVVLLSSALVYGAYVDNPVPITEGQRVAPVPGLAYAATKAALERRLDRWAAATGSEAVILRPTTTISERGVSYIAGALRSATTLRSEVGAPPVQFLHHDDLAAAVAHLATRSSAGPFNVAPDGWIDPEVFRDLLLEVDLPVPDRLGAVTGPLARTVRRRPAGLDDYVRHPWVVANDRLRATGWTPRFSNEETFVAGHPAPEWRAFALRRRQELALSALGAVTLGAVGAAGLTARHVLRPR